MFLFIKEPSTIFPFVDLNAFPVSNSLDKLPRIPLPEPNPDFINLLSLSDSDIVNVTFELNTFIICFFCNIPPKSFSGFFPFLFTSIWYSHVKKGDSLRISNISHECVLDESNKIDRKSLKISDASSGNKGTGFVLLFDNTILERVCL